MDESKIFLKSGREKSLLRKHPWLFAGAIDKISGYPLDGETALVYSSKGKFLAKGAFSSHSQIKVRIWTWDENEEINEDFFRQKLLKALELRQSLISSKSTNAFRLVHAESDEIPGLIIDLYQKTAVVQSLSSGVEFWLEKIVKILPELISLDSVFERSDTDIRKLEGLPLRTRKMLGEDIPKSLVIQENNVHFGVDLREGHKTGFYLDQRENRRMLRFLASDKKVLDCFSYTGGFTINSLLGGANSVRMVDSSLTALDCAQYNLKLNGLSLEKVQIINQNAFTYLRSLRDSGEQFDLVILDPPKFAPTISQVEKASRGYKDINLLGMKLVRKGGILATFSCSGGVSEDLFQKILAGAAMDANRDAKIIGRFHPGLDHPVGLRFPEGSYLKGFLIQL